jgi:Cdc6-like AAA superfamily ATPase
MLISNVTKASTVNNSLLPIDNLIIRNNFINDIGRKLKSNSSSLYIAGEAGVGKTQLVRKYLDLNKNDYQVIWWINFKNDITFQVKELKKELQDQICESRCDIPID